MPSLRKAPANRSASKKVQGISKGREQTLKQALLGQTLELNRAIQKLRVEINDRARAEKELEGRLAFEKLLTAISSRFISLAADRIDGEIRAAQKEICECLGLDVSALWQFPAEKPEDLLLAHVYVPSDFPVDVPTSMNAMESFPWCMEMLTKKKIIVLSRLTDAPAAAATDVESWKHFGIQSSLAFPLSVGGGSIFGALSFNTLQERVWNKEQVDNLRIVSQIFANALNRRLIEESLRDSETRYRLLFDSAPEGILLIGADGHVRAANVSQARLYGYESPQQLAGMYAPMFVSEQDRERAAQNMEDLLQGKELRDRTYTAVRSDGSEFVVEVTSAILWGPNREVQGYLCITRDITERRQSEMERVQLRLELAHLARVMTMHELSASLAHEINQPLGAILNNASAAKVLLARLRDKPEDLTEIVEDIIRDTKRAGDVVRKIRGMVKKGETQFEKVQLNELIEEVIALFRNSINLNKVALFVDLLPGLAEVKGDRVRLQQVLLNLITNALEAMKESPAKILTISTYLRQHDLVMVSVSDSGPGINEAIRDLVFKPFFTTKNDGLGFGLPICWSIIDEHGGRIWVENNPERGATVSFSLKAWKEGSA